ncbi:MAG TPA: helix-turn-helix domain-containing protein [Bacteroidota bacterium]|nr:helix-turn-helix domain-containing protein [Bacteroidota bacterium]
MNTFFQDLRRAREEKKLSLADIADRTLINLRYLEALERGETSILPEAYVRAFIREYASAIGLDGAETLRRFDQIRRPAPEPPIPSRTPPPVQAPKKPPFSLAASSLLTPRMATIAAGAVIVAVAAVLGWNLFSPGSPAPVTEIPFQNVVREAEAVTEAAHPPPPPPVRHVDSLTLSASVSDTLWMTITVDSLPPHEYIFHPGAKATWHAADRFLLTLGNAGAVSFALNQKSLGALGRRGSVMRNVPLTRQTLAGR